MMMTGDLPTSQLFLMNRYKTAMKQVRSTICVHLYQSNIQSNFSPVPSQYYILHFTGMCISTYLLVALCL
jgi:hypothetical protein